MECVPGLAYLMCHVGCRVGCGTPQVGRLSQSCRCRYNSTRHLEEGVYRATGIIVWSNNRAFRAPATQIDRTPAAPAGSRKVIFSATTPRWLRASSKAVETAMIVRYRYCDVSRL